MKRTQLKLPYLRLRIESSAAERKFTTRDIVAAVEREYHAGHLPHGARLPPIRVLQHQLGVAKNAVQDAYAELVARGAVENRARLGYFIEAQQSQRSQVGPIAPACPVMFDVTPTAAASKAGRAAINLGSVFIDPELLPRERIAQCFRAVLKKPIESDYSHHGFAPLCELIADRLTKRGIPATAEDVILTAGSQQALDLVIRSLQRGSIGTENPAYAIAKRLFEIGRIKVLDLPLDPFKGIDLEVWRQRITRGRPALLYLTTNYQNPTGYSYSTSELARILELSRELQFGLLEDDWGSDMLSYSDFRPSLRTLGGENVLYINSFTKKLLPSLRIGYLLANERVRAALLEAKRVSTLATPPLVEAAVFEFISRGYYDTHLKSLQAELDRRYQLCLQTLSAVMPEEVRWSTPGGGPALWLEIPQRVDLSVLSDRLAVRNVILGMDLQAWFFRAPHLHGTRLGYAQLPAETMQKGLEILAQEIRRQLQ